MSNAHRAGYDDRMRRSRTSISLIAALACGCHEIRPDRAPLLPDGEHLPILNQVAGTYSREDRPMRLVIRDAAMLAQVPLVDVPVDFRKEMLLVITLGRRLSDQYRVQINRVWRDGGLLKVDYTVVAPDGNPPLAISSPFCIAVVPRCDLNVEGFSATIPVLKRRRVPELLQEQRDIPTRP